MTHLLCFGLGYSAGKLAADLKRQGWTISATSTTPEGAARIGASGYRGFVLNGSEQSPGLASAVSEATHAVVSAPPGAEGDPVLRQLKDVIAASPNLRFIGYLSTIGVYGDHGGAWIDETTLVKPGSERSRRRVAAEQGWFELARATGKKAIAFRIAGIYGPGRSAIESVLDGTARRLIKRDQVFNRIHRDDIATMVAAAITGAPQFDAYNVCDDEPAPPQDVVAYAAQLLQRPIPPDIPFDAARVSEMTASFYAENKRASNARGKADLNWRPQYPTYREGLAAIAAELPGGQDSG